MRKLYLCGVTETELLKHGDIFTVFPDKTARNWQMVEDRTFVACPHDLNKKPRLLAKWKKAVVKAEETNAKRVEL